LHEVYTLPDVTESFDTVIVGGGIAGAALATVLARGGLEVCVLERQTEYKDRVRGEWMAPWGVVEAQKMGLYDLLMEAGGNHVVRQLAYGDWISPEDAEAGAFPLEGMVPGVAGPLCLAHFTATEALAQAAADAGATVVRGAGGVEVGPGAEPEVGWTVDGVSRRARCRIIVGADGRVSSVRERAGIGLKRVPERNHLSGLLVDDFEWPAENQVIGAEGALMYLIFPQAAGRARLYLGLPNSERGRFTGPSGVANFVETFRFDSLPGSERVSAATVAGPCAAYPGDDTWTDEPFAAGVVLVGDAAGYSDPTIGQGLSIAMRDVRMVSEAMLASADWTPDVFKPYAEERRECMKRLRISAELVGRLHVIETPDATEIRKHAFPKTLSDPTLFMLIGATFFGPEVLPPDALEPGVVDSAFAG
jgi:2-polyprenyl-6-methoxyphenol hydroxylase-like FAD-dependent oxidoreductase